MSARNLMDESGVRAMTADDRTPSLRPAWCCAHASCTRVTLRGLCERHRQAAATRPMPATPPRSPAPAAAEEIAA